MKKQEEIRLLLDELERKLPTLIVLGLTADENFALYMESPGKTPRRRFIDVVTAVAMIMEQSQTLREVLYTAISWHMQGNPKYQEKMREALKLLEKSGADDEEGGQL